MYNATYDEYLTLCVQDGLAPYDPGNITTWWDDIDRRKITITFERFPKLHFKYTIDVLSDLEKQYVKIGKEMRDFLFYRPAKPVDDHIILGSE